MWERHLAWPGDGDRGVGLKGCDIYLRREGRTRKSYTAEQRGERALDRGTYLLKGVKAWK